MAQSERQKKINALKNGLWDAVAADVSEASATDEDITEGCCNWDYVQQYLNEVSGKILDVCDDGLKDYSGTLKLRPSDRKKIIDQVEDSCLSDEAVASIEKLLKA